MVPAIKQENGRTVRFQNGPAKLCVALTHVHSCRLNSCRRGPQDGSKKSLPGVPLEQVGPTHVALQRLDPSVARDLHHGEHVGAGFGGAGQEARPE